MISLTISGKTMTEAEWLACTDPRPMLHLLGGKASNRKLRLFACACCRQLWHLLVDERSRHAVQAAEGLAEEQATLAELGEARDAAQTAYEEANRHADKAMDAMSFGDYAFFGNQSARRWAAKAAVDSATQTPGQAAASVAEDYILTATTRCLSHLEASWWGWDRPEAEAEKAAIDTAARQALCALLRDIFGNPFHPVTIDSSALTADIVKQAEAIYHAVVPMDQLLPFLADDLEKAGCTNSDMLSHCRQPGQHVRGCWVVDLVLAKK
jgi:hypothetical protein